MKIYEELSELIAREQPCVLATLVATHGSSPQNVGAKVIFLPDGRIIGTIGGGCMEAEARRIALDCLRKKTCRLFDLRLDDDFGWDDGLICGGRVDIFVNPNPEGSAEAYRSALDAAANHERAALCTYVSGNQAGTSMLIRQNGGQAGRTGRSRSSPRDGAVDESVASVLEEGREKLVDLGDGVSAYIEPILPRPTVLIAGAGHIGAALAQVCSVAGFEVVVVDDRPSFANESRLPLADRVVVDEIPGFIRDFPINDQTFIVVVTRGHRHDAQCLRECIHSNAKYIGMIGSKRKICVIYEEMLRDGLATPEELARVRSPMGLTIGDREVGEIAVSIAAELIAVRRGVDPDSIRPMQYVPPFVTVGSD